MSGLKGHTPPPNKVSCGGGGEHISHVGSARAPRSLCSLEARWLVGCDQAVQSSVSFSVN